MLDLIDAKMTPGRLETSNDGKTVIVRDSMISYYEALCEYINHDLSEIPKILKKHGLSEYDSEGLQRSILSDGFRAIESAVYDGTLSKLKKIGLFPGVQEKLAQQNIEAIPNSHDLRIEIENLAGAVESNLKGLDQPLDPESLVFSSGTLCIPAEYVREIATRYTLPVTEEHLAIAEKIRSVALMLAELKTCGIQIYDEIRSPVRGDGHTLQVKGLITRLAEGEEFTDAELISQVLGIPCAH